MWGAAEAYPPENADLALLSVHDRRRAGGMRAGAGEPGARLGACLIANRASWETRDLDEVVASICAALPEAERSPAGC